MTNILCCLRYLPPTNLRRHKSGRQHSKLTTLPLVLVTPTPGVHALTPALARSVISTPGVAALVNRPRRPRVPRRRIAPRRPAPSILFSSPLTPTASTGSSITPRAGRAITAVASMAARLARRRKIPPTAGNRLPAAARRLAHRPTRVPVIAGAAAGNVGRPPLSILTRVLGLPLPIGGPIAAVPPRGAGAALRPVVFATASFVLGSAGTIVVTVRGSSAAGVTAVSGITNDWDGLGTAWCAIGRLTAGRISEGLRWAFVNGGGYGRSADQYLGIRARQVGSRSRHSQGWAAGVVGRGLVKHALDAPELSATRSHPVISSGRACGCRREIGTGSGRRGP